MPGSLVKNSALGFAQTAKSQQKKSCDVHCAEEEPPDLLLAEGEVLIKKQAKRKGKRQDMDGIAIQFASMDE